MSRENLVSTDLVGLSGDGTPFCQHEDLAFDHRVPPQSEMEFSPFWDSIIPNGGKLEHHKPQTLQS